MTEQNGLLFRDSGILLWDSMKELTEEYIRSCFLLERSDHFGYYACHDGVHNDYIVIDLGMQLVFNTMCNHYFFYHI
jgi:hypothetical protein